MKKEDINTDGASSSDEVDCELRNPSYHCESEDTSLKRKSTDVNLRYFRQLHEATLNYASSLLNNAYKVPNTMKVLNNGKITIAVT